MGNGWFANTTHTLSKLQFFAYRPWLLLDNNILGRVNKKVHALEQREEEESSHAPARAFMNTSTGVVIAKQDALRGTRGTMHQRDYPERTR